MTYRFKQKKKILSKQLKEDRLGYIDMNIDLIEQQILEWENAIKVAKEDIKEWKIIKEYIEVKVKE